MSTLVFHGSSLGVTEYTPEFKGLAGDLEVQSDGLYVVDAAERRDNLAPFVSSFGIGIDSESSRLQRFPDRCYVQHSGDAALRVDVLTPTAVYSYLENLARQRNRRFVFGKGIRGPYLGYSFSSPGGTEFLIDSIEFGDRSSKQRKV